MASNKLLYAFWVLRRQASHWRRSTFYGKNWKYYKRIISYPISFWNYNKVFVQPQNKCDSVKPWYFSETAMIQWKSLTIVTLNLKWYNCHNHDKVCFTYWILCHAVCSIESVQHFSVDSGCHKAQLMQTDPDRFCWNLWPCQHYGLNLVCVYANALKITTC